MDSPLEFIQSGGETLSGVVVVVSSIIIIVVIIIIVSIKGRN